MTVRPNYFRRRLSAARSIEPVLGELHSAEALEDRTLLSGLTGFEDQSDLLAGDPDLTEDAPRDVYGELQQLVAGYLEAQLAFAETADFEPLVESRDHFGDVRLAASSFDALAAALAKYELSDREVWFEVVGTDSLVDKSKPVDDGRDLITDELPDGELIVVDETLVTELQVDAEVVTSAEADVSTQSVTVRLHRMAATTEFDIKTSSDISYPMSGLGGLGLIDNSFEHSSPDEGSTNRHALSGIASEEKHFEETTSDVDVSNASLLSQPHDDIAVSSKSEFVPIPVTADSADSLDRNADSGDWTAGLRTNEFMLAAASTPSVDSAAFVEVAFASWQPEVAGRGVAVSLATTAVGTVETQMLLASVEPLEVSGVVTEPLQPILGLASSVVLMVQTIGRTALLAVFGEGGTGGGPIAEFIEPVIDLADIGAPPERWEMKTVDAVVRGPVAQAVGSDRHFEIRNIGPAQNLDGALPDVATLTLLTLPRHGVLEHVGVRQNVFKYVPDPGFSGVDEFRYRLKTASGESHEGQMVINVPATSANVGLRTATRDIELRLEVDRNVATTNDAFEAFDEWRGGLD